MRIISELCEKQVNFYQFPTEGDLDDVTRKENEMLNKQRKISSSSIYLSLSLRRRPQIVCLSAVCLSASHVVSCTVYGYVAITLFT